jgi:hypothetical protein
MDDEQKKQLAYVNKLIASLKSLYGSAYTDVFKLTEVKNAIKDGKQFTWNGNPNAERKLDEQLKSLSRQTGNIIRSGITGSWKLGEDAVKDEILKAFGKAEFKPEINAILEQAVKGHRARGMNAYQFANQKQGGLNLSDNVWNLAGNAKKEIEIIIQNRILEGKGANSVAVEVQKYLNEPDKLFRRIRVTKTDADGNEHDEFQLSKAAKAYKPGRGIYRSAYKNALRLTITEMNRAYRRAEWESYQNNPLIKGYRIALSNNHTAINQKTGEAEPLYDICDELQGEYPKTFLWEGWHPHCRCRMIPIFITREEMKERMIARRDNKLDEWKPENEVKEVPKKLNEWIQNNKNRIENAEKLPYWMIDNANFINLQFNEVNMIQQRLFSLYKEFGGGGKIEVMEGYTPKRDHRDLFSIARYFAKKGDKVQITTDVHFKDEKYAEAFGKLNKTPYERKCPDLIINGKFYEYEGFMKPFKNRKLANMISHGTKQASRIIINNNKGCSDRYILTNIHNRLRDKNFKNNIDEVLVYEKGKVRLLYKKK